jgi:uncharacterized protein
MDLEDIEERLNRPPSNKQWIGLIIIALALLGSTFLAARAWVQVKTRTVRTIDVTGSAKRRIFSDLIQWTSTLSSEIEADRAVAYRNLKRQVDKALDYLKKQGIKDTEFRVSSVQTAEISETEVSGAGDKRLEQQVFKGDKMTQRITVSSSDVHKIERISREITGLMETGVPIASSPPDYYYTKLGELKIRMLAEAAKDARMRAEQMLSAAGNVSIGELRRADMGVINVNQPNSTATSWEGNNDTTTLEKDIIAIVHCTFDVAISNNPPSAIQ